MEEVNTLLSRAKFGVQVTYTDLQKLFDEVDTADKGIIDFNGFIEIMSSLKKRDREEMSRAFTMFDVDGDGFITGEELYHVMSSLGESFTCKEIDAMIREADTDGDGRINFEGTLHGLHINLVPI